MSLLKPFRDGAFVSFVISLCGNPIYFRRRAPEVRVRHGSGAFRQASRRRRLPLRTTSIADPFQIRNYVNYILTCQNNISLILCKGKFEKDGSANGL